MSKIGYGMNWREATVLGYSGLRGAVSLSLALIVELDHEVHPEIKDIVLFHTAGIALLTLFINGSTMGFLVKGLGLMRMPDVKKKMVRNLIRAYKKEVHDTIDKMKSRKNFGKVDWDDLKLLACTDKIRDQIFKKRKIDHHKSDMESSRNLKELALVIDNQDYNDQELYIEAKHRYLTLLKGLYWDFFEKGQ